MAATHAAHPGLQRAGGAENGERRERGLDSRSSCSDTRSGAGRGKGANRRGRRARGSRGGGGGRLPDNRAGAQPSLRPGGREGSQGTPRAGPATAGGTSALSSRAPASGVLSGRGPRLPCIPAPGRSPRSERTGCRPPWPRQPAGGGRAGGGLAAAAPPPAERPASLPCAPRTQTQRRPAPSRQRLRRAQRSRGARGGGWWPGGGGRGAPGTWVRAHGAAERSWARRRRGLKTCESAEKGCARLRARRRGPGRTRTLPALRAPPGAAFAFRQTLP